MKTFLHAHRLSLELPLDVRQDVGDTPGTLKAALGGRERLYRKILSDIDFRAEEGDRIGLLGLNGAGKTTLLRVLNGAFPPTHGRLARSGTTQSLLNPTLGFDGDATVVENVFLRGTAMGLRMRQLRAALDDILGFAGLTEKAGHPLHTLSSGQRMRLGFAISTAVQPDILLMDEWLSTGDAAFLERAQKRMRSRFNDSRIVVLASHSPAMIRILCNKALVLDEGRMRFFGPVDDAMLEYRAIVSKASAAMRDEIAKADPLLFGEIAGLIERIRVLPDGVQVEGWAATDRAAEVAVIRAELAGHHQVLENFERIDRNDVRLHLGRSSGRYGFRFELSGRTGFDAAAVSQHLVLNVGRSERSMSAPLPVAPGAILENYERPIEMQHESLAS